MIIYVTVRSWVHAGLVYLSFYFPAFRDIADPEYLVTIYLMAGALGTVLEGLADWFGRNGLLVSIVVSLIVVYPLHLSGNWIPFLALYWD